MKKLLAIAVLAAFPIFVFAQLLVPQGGSGLPAVPPGYLLTGSTSLRFVSKYLIAGSNVTIASTTNSITISATGGTGGGVSDWIQDTNYNVLTLTASTSIPVWFKSNIYASSSAIIAGSVGIGSSSPWAKLSVVGGNLVPLFSISTTTNAAPIFHVTSTSSDPMNDFGRITVGTLGQYGNGTGNGTSYDTFVVDGRMNYSQGYREAWADSFPLSLSADTLASGGWYFFEDNTCTFNRAPGVDRVFWRMSSGTVNDGCSLTLSGLGLLLLGSSTPVMETEIRHTGGGLSTTTAEFIVGFSNVDSTGTALEASNDLGCFLMANATTTNWQAVCRITTAAAFTTKVDTGVATSTNPGSLTTGRFQTWRIEVSSSTARFYESHYGSPWGLKAEITTNIPTGVYVSPLIRTVNWQRGATRSIDIGYVRAWWYQDPAAI